MPTPPPLPESHTGSAPTAGPRFSLKSLLIGSAVLAVLLGLLAVMPPSLLGIPFRLLKIALPGVLLAMAWASVGCARVGYAASLIPIVAPEYFEGSVRAFSMSNQVAYQVLGSTPLHGVYLFGGEFFSQLLICGVTGASGYLVARWASRSIVGNSHTRS